MAALLHQLPARVLDRVPRRTVEEPLPAPDHRPVLRHVPDPDARLADDARRPGPGRPPAPLRPPDQRHRRQRPPAGHADRRRRRHHLQLPALHGAAALRRARADRRTADRGGAGPVREQAARVPARDAAALDARRHRRHAADVHPGRGRLRQRAAPRHPAPVHDRERDPVEVPRADRLPGGGCALAAPDGDHPRPAPRLRAGSRHGEAARDDRRAPLRPPPRADRATRALAFVYLLLPIAVVVLFSFNHPKGRFNYTWQGFTLDNWRHWDAVPGLRELDRGLARDRLPRRARRDRARHADRPRPRPATASAAAARPTCSSSCRWPRRRSCSAPRCSRSS